MTNVTQVDNHKNPMADHAARAEVLWSIRLEPAETTQNYTPEAEGGDTRCQQKTAERVTEALDANLWGPTFRKAMSKERVPKFRHCIERRKKVDINIRGSRNQARWYTDGQD